MTRPLKRTAFDLPSTKTKLIRCTMLSMISLCLVFNLFYFYHSIHSFLTKSFISHTNDNVYPPVLFVPPPPTNLTMAMRKVYHHNGIAYDHYSKSDFGRWKNLSKWKHWSLPQESFDNAQISPLVVTKLPFVDVIYAISDARLTERHANLRKALHQQGISQESLDWRMKWNYQTCNSNESRSYVYRRLNLKNITLDKGQRQRCALAMKHADVWYEMAERKVGLALIVEDDAIFVPFFKEKFTRMIYAAMKEGILRLNGTCVVGKLSASQLRNGKIKIQ